MNFFSKHECAWFISIGYIRILFVDFLSINQKSTPVQKRKVALDIKQKQEIISKYNSGTKSKELAFFNKINQKIYICPEKT